MELNQSHFQMKILRRIDLKHIGWSLAISSQEIFHSILCSSKNRFYQIVPLFIEINLKNMEKGFCFNIYWGENVSLSLRYVWWLKLCLPIDITTTNTVHSAPLTKCSNKFQLINIIVHFMKLGNKYNKTSYIKRHRRRYCFYF